MSASARASSAVKWRARRAAGLLAACLCAWAAAVQAAPRHVMSLNLCADQLLLELLPPERIASLTWLSRSEGDPYWRATVNGLPSNHGSAEEVVATAPDLVVAGAFTTATTRALVARAGIPLLQLPPVQDWEGIRRVTRELALAVGEVQRGERLIARMDATLAALAATRPAVPVRVIGWGGSGADVPGRDTLFDAILTAAGGQNIGAALVGRRSVDLEQVLQAHPQVLLYGEAYASMPALRNEVAQHRVLARAYAGAQLSYPEAIYSCGVPRAADAAAALRPLLYAAARRWAP